MSVLWNHASHSALLSLKKKFVKEKESTKKREDELTTYLPKLQEIEEEYKSKSKRFQELGRILTGMYEALRNWPEAQVRISPLSSNEGVHPPKQGWISSTLSSSPLTLFSRVWVFCFFSYLWISSPL